MTVKKKIRIIYAAGIHSGGGLFILNYLKKKISSKKNIFFLDERLKVDKFYRKFNVFYVKKTFFSKFYNELKIKLLYDSSENEIIFLNGLPPIFKFKSMVVSYFQNANIIKSKKNLVRDFFSLDYLRSLKFHVFKKNVDKWIVFSRFAKKSLNKHVRNNKIFQEEIFIKKIKISSLKKYDFIYPASGENHKNHKNLIQAFVILSQKKIFPRLLLTLSKTEFDKFKIKYLRKKFKLRIFNKQNKNREKFLSNYIYSKALIFPSFTETLGLPLLEAKSYGIDILASNRNFAKDYTIKSRLFEPSKPKDIAKKIINYSKYKK